MLARHAAFKDLDATFLTTRCDFSNSLRITSLEHPCSLTPIESHPYQKHRGSPGFSPKPPVFRTFFQVPYPLTPFFSHTLPKTTGVGGIVTIMELCAIGVSAREPSGSSTSYELPGNRHLRRNREKKYTRREISMGGVGTLGGAFDQLAENGGNLVEVRGLVQKVVRARGHAFISILRIRKVRANQHLQPGMPWPDRSQNVQPRASGHLQVQDDRIGIRLLDGRNRFRHVAGLPDHLDARNVLQQVVQPFDHKFGVICNKDAHLPLSSAGLGVHAIENDKSRGKYIGWKPQSLVGQCETRMKAGSHNIEPPCSRAQRMGVRPQKEGTNERSPSIHQLRAEREADEFRGGFHPGFLQDARTIGAHGLYAQRKLVGNVFDRLAGANHAQYLEFAVGEQLMNRRVRSSSQIVGQALRQRHADVAAAGEHALNRLLQLLGNAILGQIPGRAGLQRAPRILLLRIHAQEENRQLRPDALQIAQDIEPAFSGHADIQDDDFPVVRADARKRFFRGFCFAEGNLGKSFANGFFQSTPKYRVIICYQDSHHKPCRGWADGDHGIRKVMVVPEPGTPSMRTSPWRRSARSCMPTSPSDFFALASSGSKPLPLSCTRKTSWSSSISRRASTLVACACRVTFVSDSWKIRKIAVDFSGSRFNGSCGRTRWHLIPVRFSNSCPCHSSAAARPRSSRVLGRKSEEILRKVPIMSSTNRMEDSILARSWVCLLVILRPISARSILMAVQAWPSSSWISRAIDARSSSRTL